MSIKDIFRTLIHQIKLFLKMLLNTFQPNVKLIAGQNLVKIPTLCTDKETKTETKQEKSIRLGQMTAFGKVLTSKSNHDEDFIAKRKWEKDWMNSGEDSDDNIQKKRKVSTYLPNYKVTHVLFLQMITYNSGILLQKKVKSSFSWPRFMLFPH